MPNSLDEDTANFYHRQAQIAQMNGFVTFCTAHNRAGCGCLIKRTYEIEVEIESVTRGEPKIYIPDWALDDDEDIPAVSLPTAPEQDKPGLEETQTWRDRPSLL